MLGKLVIFGLLVVFLIAISYQPAFADSEEAVVLKNHLKLSIGAGLTLGTESFMEKSGQESFFVNFGFGAFDPDLGDCGNGRRWRKGKGPLPYGKFLISIRGFSLFNKLCQSPEWRI